MVVAASTIAAKEHPALAYERQLEPPPDRSAAAALEPVNAFMKELVRCRNFGEEYSLEELATRCGVTMETARELEATVKKTDERNKIDIEGGIAGYRSPPPARRLFCWEILEPLGLVEIEDALDRGRAAEATYRMSAGPLINVFVHLSPEWQ